MKKKKKGAEYSITVRVNMKKGKPVERTYKVLKDIDAVKLAKAEFKKKLYSVSFIWR